MSFSFPKLTRSEASDEVDDFNREKQFNPDDIMRSIDIHNTTGVVWDPIGDHVEIDLFARLRKNLISALSKSQNGVKKTISRNEMDVCIGKFLFEAFENKLTPSVASDVEVWYFFNIRVFPDLIIRRWSKRETNGKIAINPERFLSANRNYCGSMWWRTFLFIEEKNSQDRYWLIRKLKEDNFVGIMERTQLRGYPNLAKEIGLKIAEIQDSTIDQGEKQLLIRRTMVVLRAKSLTCDFSYLAFVDENQPQKIVENSFAIAKKTLEEEGHRVQPN
ncbi:MAG: DUF6339 family protein [Saccharofermentanales bacterium]